MGDEQKTSGNIEDKGENTEKKREKRRRKHADSELEALKRGVKLLKQDEVLHLPENEQETLDSTLLGFWILVKMLTHK